MDEVINETEENIEKKKGKTVSPISSLYQDWFLEYASYVILERAVPTLEDGLKPVQRRILHSMKELDDGRFHKVANIIGNTMQYHPHGDAAIGEAIVNLGQKDLLIETQGNWGDFITGDGAAASRYIEAKLSKFALDVAFSLDITDWKLSYDSRRKEPILLPMKFPLLLAQGAEGIAVGLATRILPHNFNELIKASINILKEKEINIIPDFPTGGMADFTNYNQGERGGRVRIRSKIEILDKKTLVIRTVPFSVTTQKIIDSIIKANDTGKIKIKRVIDNTAQDVEILIELAKGISPDVTIDALYAFTSCENSISPNACVIVNEKPAFLNVNELLLLSTQNTKLLLRKELEVKGEDLAEKWHFASLEKIFIEKRIYRDIEECETWESVIESIDKGLKPHIKHLKREITRDDIIRLTEIKIKRISKYDSFKADEIIERIEKDLSDIKYNLAHLTEYAIKYFEELLKNYSKGKERKTEIRAFDTIEAKSVVAVNKKLYINKKEGFVGFGLKKEECIGECSELDDIISFRKDGKYSINKVDEKVFVGKNIIHVEVFNKDEERLIYNVIYLDGKSGRALAKRFNVTSVSRDKEYDVTKGSRNSRILYFTANPLGETDIVTVFLSQSCKARNKVIEFDFANIAIKGRNSYGNILTKYPIRKIVQKSVDTTNILGRDIWFDEYIGKLNNRETGKYLGSFLPADKIIAFYKDGNYQLSNSDFSNHFNMDKLLYLEKFNPDRIITVVYFNGKSKIYFVKRFKIETQTMGKSFNFISETRGSELKIVSTGDKTIIKFSYYKGKNNSKQTDHLELSEFIDVKGWKATGNKLNNSSITGLKLVDIVYEEREEQEESDNYVDSKEEKKETKEVKKDEVEASKRKGREDSTQLKLF